MSFLTPASAAALSRLRAFASPPTHYTSLPLSRRAAVLILLFADRAGHLRVVLTIRSIKLKNYAGQAALPGGKADSGDVDAWETARREAWEEIGLPLDRDGTKDRGSGRGSGQEEHGGIGKGWKVERLGELPCNLAVTELGVRPCLGYLSHATGRGEGVEGADPIKDLLPTLDAKEVAAVFTAPFRNFLRTEDESPRMRSVPGKWYEGNWVNWHEEKWRMHQFFVPKGLVFRSDRVVRSSPDGDGDGDGDGDDPVEGELKIVVVAGRSVADADGRRRRKLEERTGEKEAAAPQTNPLDQPRYKVFGMTARILVDAARVAYGEEPEFEHNSHFGDEDMIGKLIGMGRLAAIRKEGEALTRDVMRAAAKM